MRLLSMLVPFVVACGPASHVQPTTAPPPSKVRDPIKVGDRAPAFEAKNVSTVGAQPIRIAPHQVNIIFFWATWSEPDKREMAELEGIWRRSHDKGLSIAAISIDAEEGGVAEAARSFGASFDVGWDAGHRIADEYKAVAEPSTYVVDREGIVRFLHQGFHDGEGAEIGREVDSLLR